MSTPLTEIVEGWTGALPFTLEADDSPIDLTGLTVYIVLKDARGTVVKDSTAGISITGTTAGQVEYAPSSSEFASARSPYRIRFRVKDASFKVIYHPNGTEELITVFPV